MAARMQVGGTVEGELFDSGVVVALGTARELKRYDKSGATEEIAPSRRCVAVRFDDGDTAVYVADEVWTAKKKAVR